ncbi:MAG TPA: ferredoxin [Spirochaetota bacterium]|nr:ferredoxin [Spirochaetota bacterium]HPN83315.1 ferredoxin [Spirochaetota bacterium]
MPVLVEEKQCSGCGVCSDIYPEVFVMLEGVARVRGIASYNAELVETVIEECPTGAIREIDD